MRALIQKLLACCLISIIINKVNCDTKNFNFYKAFKTPKENYDENCAELDKMEILERSNFSLEDEKEDTDVKSCAEERKNSALAQVHVRFGNNNNNNHHGYQKGGFELAPHHPVQYNFYMSGQPIHHMMPFFNPHWSYPNLPMCFPRYNFHSNLHHIPTNEFNPGSPDKAVRRSDSTSTTKPQTDHETYQKLMKFIETYQKENEIVRNLEDECLEVEIVSEPTATTENEVFVPVQRKTNYKRLEKLSDQDLGLLLEIFDNNDLQNITKNSKRIKRRSVGYNSNRLIPSVFIKNVIFEPCQEVHKPLDNKLIISDSLKFIALNISDILDTVCDCIDELSLEKDNPRELFKKDEEEEHFFWTNDD